MDESYEQLHVSIKGCQIYTMQNKTQQSRENFVDYQYNSIRI